MINFSSILLLFLLIYSGYSLQCYRCSASSRNAEKADKACVNGYSNIRKQECPEDYFCTTYQYEISTQGLIKSSLTIRGCGPEDMEENCENLLEGVRELVYPARVREKICMSCSTDLCNGSAN